MNFAIETILNRQTIRSYTKEQLTESELQTIFDAALRAPSARNNQPCYLYAVQNDALLDEMNTDFKNIVGWNTPAYTGWDKGPFYHGAPTFIFIFADGDSAMDTGIMAENITLAAKALGLASCIVGSIGALFNEPTANAKWKQKLGVPESRCFQLGIALGHPAETPPMKPRENGHTFIIR